MWQGVDNTRASSASNHSYSYINFFEFVKFSYLGLSFFLQGVDNTSHSCIFCLHQLATNPEEQERLYTHLVSSSKQVNNEYDYQ